MLTLQLFELLSGTPSFSQQSTGSSHVVLAQASHPTLKAHRSAQSVASAPQSISIGISGRSAPLLSMPYCTTGASLFKPEACMSVWRIVNSRINRCQQKLLTLHKFETFGRGSYFSQHNGCSKHLFRAYAQAWQEGLLAHRAAQSYRLAPESRRMGMFAKSPPGISTPMSKAWVSARTSENSTKNDSLTITVADRPADIWKDV